MGKLKFGLIEDDPTSTAFVQEGTCCKKVFLDAVAPNDADDHDLNGDETNVGSGDYVDNLGDDDDVVSADEQSNL